MLLTYQTQKMRNNFRKNLRLQMGRCPVRSVFPEALAVLEQKHELLECVFEMPLLNPVFSPWFVSDQNPSRFMFDQTMPLSEVLSGYGMFEKMKVQKVVFLP